MLNWISLISGYDNSRHTEFLQNAEKEQLVRIALEGKEPTDPFYYGALAAVGRQLLAVRRAQKDRRQRRGRYRDRRATGHHRQGVLA